MKLIWAKLKVPLAVLCTLCFAVITALAALVPNAMASDGGGGTALQPSIAAITAQSPYAAQSAFVEKSPAGQSARSTS